MKNPANPTGQPGTFLSGLGRAAAGELLHLGSPRRFHQGFTIINPHERATSVLLLLTGLVKIHQVTRRGQTLILGVRGPGELLGERAALYGDGRRTATVTAVSPVSARFMSHAEFAGFLHRHPRAWHALCLSLLGRLAESESNREDFLALDLAARVRQRLDRLAHLTCEPPPVSLAITQDDLAGWVGASRESVSRVLSDLRAAKVVATARGRIVVLDPSGLGGAAAP